MYFSVCMKEILLWIFENINASLTYRTSKVTQFKLHDFRVITMNELGNYPISIIKGKLTLPHKKSSQLKRRVIFVKKRFKIITKVAFCEAKVTKMTFDQFVMNIYSLCHFWVRCILHTPANRISKKMNEWIIRVMESSYKRLKRDDPGLEYSWSAFRLRCTIMRVDVSSILRKDRLIWHVINIRGKKAAAHHSTFRDCS